MSEIQSLEHPTLKVPYEILNKKFRSSQKTLDREAAAVFSSCQEIDKSSVMDVDLAPNVAGICDLLDNTVVKLGNYKRKIEESFTDELDAAQICKRRIEHLRMGASAFENASDPNNEPVLSQWKRTRLDRFLVEHLLRTGHYATAMKLIDDNRQLKSLTNIDIYLVAQAVETSLLNRETATALAWCHDNRSKLKKLHSQFEFHLRKQDFIELIRTGRRVEAVRHARKYLVGQEDVCFEEVQQCTGMFAFSTSDTISPYKHLLDPDRWSHLVEEFRSENYRLFQLSTQSVFSAVLQAGLSVLKTPQCYGSRDKKNPDCPICEELLNELAKNSPYAHCSQSRLIDSISGQPMNSDNVPMMLPNGYVYGEKSLQDLAAENEGIIVCPKTKEIYDIREMKKVYVM
ncbi:E3 ubiquitin-protein transferase MAEA-like [Artemia franciscana]|uniref:E3 ubiquitin-protein transferase MAEA n=2 Tax=Artemia franciscana TaxID=6661 RepID=A0AA88HI11_ARTSF|nr:hypothetical protein QYM36_015936 [Artemia franciscana]